MSISNPDMKNPDKLPFRIIRDNGEPQLEHRYSIQTKHAVKRTLKQEADKSGKQQNPLPKETPPICATILVVDDDPLVQRMLKRIFQEKGHTVLIANNGQEGVDVYAEKGQTIDITFLDFHMPVMDGKAALREIMKLNPNACVTVFSGFETDKDMQDMLELGAQSITKPFTMEEICQRVTQALLAKSTTKK